MARREATIARPDTTGAIVSSSTPMTIEPGDNIYYSYVCGIISRRSQYGSRRRASHALGARAQTDSWSPPRRRPRSPQRRTGGVESTPSLFESTSSVSGEVPPTQRYTRPGITRLNEPPEQPVAMTNDTMATNLPTQHQLRGTVCSRYDDPLVSTTSDHLITASQTARRNSTVIQGSREA